MPTGGKFTWMGQMNAQVGLCRRFRGGCLSLEPAQNLLYPWRRGPGMGPIGVMPHLVAFLPGHSVISTGGEQALVLLPQPGGSASILTISWMYIAMMGAAGLTEATK